MGKPSPVPIDNLIDELGLIVKEAIKTAIQDFNPFVVCLSGGMDSSMLLALLKETGASPTLAVTMANSEEHPDYRAAKIVAETLNIPWQSFIVEKPLAVPAGRLHVMDGDDAVYTLYELLHRNGVSRVLCTDGIDELMGGYLAHQTEQDFIYYLGRLWSCHLEPLLATAAKFEIRLRFPYLDYRLADFVTRLPLELKTSGDSRKIIWRKLAERYVPGSIINRRKIGQCSMLNWKP